MQDEWPSKIRSKIVSLNSIKLEKIEDESPVWLSAAEKSILGTSEICSLESRLRANDIGYWIRPSNQTTTLNLTDPIVGAVSLRKKNRQLQWMWLAVDQSVRGWGYGASAVDTIERQAIKKNNLTDACVLVPINNGIALYFWLRLGYRPLNGSTWPQPYSGTWMVRGLH